MAATEDAKKALVIEAFDTLFNRRDHAGAEAFRSPDHIQHSAHIAPGRTGLFDLVSGLPMFADAFPSAPSTPVSISAGLPESALANEQLAAFLKLHARRDGAEAGVR
jgi:predicted SnoaL-like aldol condensation-catalyzing enzyme